MLFLAGPDIEEWADICFFIFRLPHDLQAGFSCVPIMRISLYSPQSSHLNSYRGIYLSFFKKHPDPGMGRYPAGCFSYPYFNGLPMAVLIGIFRKDNIALLKLLDRIDYPAALIIGHFYTGGFQG